MAYRRRIYRSRRFPRRYRRSLTRRSVSRMITRREELKVFSPATSVTTAFGSVSNTWSELDLAQVPVGSGSPNRIGQQIRIKELYYHLTMEGGTTNVATDDSHNTIRLVMGLYQGAGGATPLATGGLNMNSIISNFYGGNLLLQRKLTDRWINFQTPGRDSTGYIPNVKTVVIHKRFKGAGLLMKWGDGTLSYPNKRLVMSMISDSSVLPNPGVIQGYGYIRFVDA